MPPLYYWRRDNHQRDLDLGAGYHLNQDNPVMHEVEAGESLWAFTRTGDGRYVLAAELVVQAKTLNRPDFRYGKYRVWGDVDQSRYFRVEGAPSVEQVIRSFSISTNARVLGRSFQGHAAVRQITMEDHQTLREVARNLPLEPRARILPEEKLEAALIMGDRSAVERLVREEEPGVAEERKQYLYEEAPSCNPDLVDRLQNLYDGHCQICRWDPVDEYGEPLCESHHIQWLSRGGRRCPRQPHARVPQPPPRDPPLRRPARLAGPGTGFRRPPRGPCSGPPPDRRVVCETGLDANGPTARPTKANHRPV